VGASAGAWALHQLSGHGLVKIGTNQIPAADVVVLVIYLLLLSTLGGFSLYEARREEQFRPVMTGWATGWQVPPLAIFSEFGETKQSIVVLSWFGLFVGFSAGLLGNSGGVLLLPGLIYLLGMKTQDAVVSSLVIVWVLSIISTTAHAWLGHVDLRLVSALLIGGTIGARWGSEIGLKLRGAQLRRWFGRLMLLTCLLILFRLLRMFGLLF
ncbi:MAG: sulfite exporter TauE/SafE family protein, partial [Planctomycetaceae bacterium]|nr:sulfite exporter TauE/SafE family protein [Planctomycetaceae bacterium]